jgi:hypothetical protein
VYPELVDVRTTLRNLSSPVLMRPNQGWFENIDISPIGNISNDSLSLEDKPAFKKLLTPTLMKQLILEDTRNIHQGKPKEIE